MNMNTEKKQETYNYLKPFFKQGLTARVVSEQTGLGTSTVERYYTEYRKVHGVKKSLDVDTAKIIKLLEKDCAVPEIMRKTGASQTKVYKIRKAWLAEKLTTTATEQTEKPTNTLQLTIEAEKINEDEAEIKETSTGEIVMINGEALATQNTPAIPLHNDQDALTQALARIHELEQQITTQAQQHNELINLKEKSITHLNTLVSRQEQVILEMEQSDKPSASYQAELQKLLDLQAQQAVRLQAMDEEKRTLTHKCAELESTIVDFEKLVDLKDNKIKNLRADLGNKTSEIEIFDGCLEAKDETIQQLESEYESTSEALKTLKVEYEQEMAQGSALVDKLQQSIDELETSLLEKDIAYDDLIQKHTDQINEITLNHHSALADSQKKIVEQHDALGFKDLQLEECAQQYNILEGQYKALLAKQNNVQTPVVDTEQVANLQAEVESLKKVIVSKNMQLSQLETIHHENKLRIAELEEQTPALAEYKAQIASLEETVGLQRSSMSSTSHDPLAVGQWIDSYRNITLNVNKTPYRMTVYTCMGISAIDYDALKQSLYNESYKLDEKPFINAIRRVELDGHVVKLIDIPYVFVIASQYKDADFIKSITEYINPPSLYGITSDLIHTFQVMLAGFKDVDKTYNEVGMYNKLQQDLLADIEGASWDDEVLLENVKRLKQLRLERREVQVYHHIYKTLRSVLKANGIKDMLLHNIVNKLEWFQNTSVVYNPKEGGNINEDTLEPWQKQLFGVFKNNT